MVLKVVYKVNTSVLYSFYHVYVYTMYLKGFPEVLNNLKYCTLSSRTGAFKNQVSKYVSYVPTSVRIVFYVSELTWTRTGSLAAFSVGMLLFIVRDWMTDMKDLGNNYSRHACLPMFKGTVSSYVRLYFRACEIESVLYFWDILCFKKFYFVVPAVLKNLL
jgi:hypothetical protein